MTALTALLAANIVVWTGFALYLFLLARKTAALEERLRRLDRQRHTPTQGN